MAETIPDRKKLKRALKKTRGRVVFTNGCFDILHAGHVRYLREAKRLGDVLVVALNSDSSVSKIKPGRPVVPVAQRMEVVAALDMVDFVTLFEETTPRELIEFLMPDVLVKGGDWEVAEIAGSDIVPETYSLPYIEGVSSTAIIKKIKKLKSR